MIQRIIFRDLLLMQLVRHCDGLKSDCEVTREVSHGPKGRARGSDMHRRLDAASLPPCEVEWIVLLILRSFSTLEMSQAWGCGCRSTSRTLYWVRHLSES